MCVFVHVTSPLFILSLDKYLICFHILPIINNAAMNIGVHVCFWIRFFILILDIYIGVELPDHTVVLFLAFWEITTLFSTMTAPTYIPTNSVRISFFSMLLPMFTCGLFNDSHSNRYEMIAHCDFNLHFSDDWRCYLLLVIISTIIYSSQELISKFLIFPLCLILFPIMSNKYWDPLILPFVKCFHSCTFITTHTNTPTPTILVSHLFWCH